MEHNRIQKLLLSEYCDFWDKVLIESPFAETTRDGRGLRQVSLGLTPSRLVIAADILKKNSEFTCPPDLDQSIENFELVSIYPLEFVALSVFRRRKRRTLKARLIDGRAKYFELGGMECRNIPWAVWCENVRNMMAKREDGSSLSETTAASSSSASTLYLLSSGVEIRANKNRKSASTCRVWAHYGGAGDGQTVSWFRKDIYLGPSYNELSHGYYTPVPVRFAGASLEELNYELRDGTPDGLVCKKTCSSWPCSRNVDKKSGKNDFRRTGGLCNVLYTREHEGRNKRERKTRLPGPGNAIDDGSVVLDKNEGRATISETTAISSLTHRYSCNTQQKRKSGSPRKHDGTSVAPKLSRFGFGVGENCNSGLYLEPWEGNRAKYRRARSLYPVMDPYVLIDGGVWVWETHGDEKSEKRKRMRHPRRYALSTAAHFFHALGPWSVQPGERESVQRKRASSAVCIRRQPVEPELRLPVSKRQLAASVSMTALDPGRAGTVSSSTRGRVVLFWTPEYWYRPRAATAAYRDLRRHLDLLRDFRTDKERSKKTFFYRRKKSNHQGDCKESTSVPMAEERSGSLLGRIFSSRDARKKMKDHGENREGGTSQLRRLLRMDLRITAWDLDSTTIARQLTLIDRELFQRIPCIEIEILITQKSSRNAPNLGAWIAFSHRISCLTTSEILATKKLDMRTRIVSRFINAAYKCYSIGNFHSCRSILAGLQSPPVYRLKSTWSHLRTHHSTRYETMEKLCKIYRKTTTRSYRRAWKRCERKPPLLPYVGDLIARILHDDDEQDYSRLDDLRWRNQPCSFDATDSPCSRDVSSTIENACRKIVSQNLVGNKTMLQKFNKSKTEEIVTENLIQGRRSIGERILSAAMIKIGYSKTRHSSSGKTKSDDPVSWTAREEMLARKFYSRWRRSVLSLKIFAANEATVRSMDPRNRRIMEISSWLCDCQRHSRGYNFPGHSLAWDFLLKARYREDKENFFISLKLEPPCR